MIASISFILILLIRKIIVTYLIIIPFVINLPPQFPILDRVNLILNFPSYFNYYFLYYLHYPFVLLQLPNCLNYFTTAIIINFTQYFIIPIPNHLPFIILSLFYFIICY